MKKGHILILVTILLVSLLTVAAAFADDTASVSNQVSGEVTINCDVQWRNADKVTLPSEVSIELFANGVPCQSAKCGSADNWQCSFTGLQKYDSKGNEIYYSAMEKPVEGFMTAVARTADGGFRFINSGKTVPVVEDTDDDADDDSNKEKDNIVDDNKDKENQEIDNNKGSDPTTEQKDNDNQDADDDADVAGNDGSDNNNGSGEGTVDDNAGKDVPKTGDESAFLLWGLAFAAAAAGFGLLVRMKRA